ncbi:hypothetical protein A0H81_08171 [Grifola frondosa]|uniref:Uncharacterized protein n=1 Tax=Grifola frondosa TaxID=5627 RepID=A0A1C7M4K3_GRIFR|nr:hypothetical protein A0H81_08171 [Grifola frondosa]
MYEAYTCESPRSRSPSRTAPRGSKFPSRTPRPAQHASVLTSQASFRGVYELLPGFGADADDTSIRRLSAQIIGVVWFARSLGARRTAWRAPVQLRPRTRGEFEYVVFQISQLAALAAGSMRLWLLVPRAAYRIWQLAPDGCLLTFNVPFRVGARAHVWGNGRSAGTFALKTVDTYSLWNGRGEGSVRSIVSRAERARASFLRSLFSQRGTRASRGGFAYSMWTIIGLRLLLLLLARSWGPCVVLLCWLGCLSYLGWDLLRLVFVCVLRLLCCVPGAG